VVSNIRAEACALGLAAHPLAILRPAPEQDDPEKDRTCEDDEGSLGPQPNRQVDPDVNRDRHP